MLQDVWVANAALSASRKAPVAEIPAQELVAIVNANLTGGWPWRGAAPAGCNSLGLPQRHCANPASAWHTMRGGMQTAMPLPVHAAGALLAAKAALPRLAPGGKFFLVDGSGRCALCREGGAGVDRAWRNTCLPLETAPRGTSRCCRLGACSPTDPVAARPSSPPLVLCGPGPPCCSNGRPTAGNAAYGATKRALVQLKDSLAAEARASGVGVHIFSPGVLPWAVVCAASSSLLPSVVRRCCP